MHLRSLSREKIHYFNVPNDAFHVTLIVSSPATKEAEKAAEATIRLTAWQYNA